MRARGRGYQYNGGRVPIQWGEGTRYNGGRVPIQWGEGTRYNGGGGGGGIIM